MALAAGLFRPVEYTRGLFSRAKGLSRLPRGMEKGDFEVEQFFFSGKKGASIVLCEGVLKKRKITFARGGLL